MIYLMILIIRRIIMEYKELLRQMIIECKNDADSFLAGNKQDYLYCKERNETYGDTDKNYTNRTRVCYGLIYGGYSPEIIEDAVRELFETEITSRENESFQGVGVNIEMLTALLLKYNNLRMKNYLNVQRMLIMIVFSDIT